MSVIEGTAEASVTMNRKVKRYVQTLALGMLLAYTTLLIYQTLSHGLVETQVHKSLNSSLALGNSLNSRGTCLRFIYTVESNR